MLTIREEEMAEQLIYVMVAATAEAEVVTQPASKDKNTILYLELCKYTSTFLNFLRPISILFRSALNLFPQIHESLHILERNFLLRNLVLKRSINGGEIFKVFKLKFARCLLVVWSAV